MRKAFVASVAGLASALLIAACAGKPAASEKKWTPGRTAWGDPDLQGQWNSQTSTPLERPQQGKLAGKETISAEEAEEFEQEERKTFDAPPTQGDPGTYNAFWRDQGKALTRTSLVVDPPDGRVPALTSEAQARLAAVRKARTGRGPADSYTTSVRGPAASRVVGTASAAGTAATTRSSSLPAT